MGRNVLLADLQIEHRGGNGVVTEQGLDRAQIDARFQQMSCEAMAKGMNADALVNTSLLLGVVVGLLRHTLVDVTLRLASLKQVFLRVVLFPVMPQVF